MSILDMPLEKLKFSNRVLNALKRQPSYIGALPPIHTVGELVKLTTNDLMKIKNLGLVSLKEIKSKLKENGLSLKESRWEREERLKVPVRQAVEIIIKAARQWCREPETSDAYEQLKGTESASAPGAFMVLYEAVEEFEKLVKGDGDEANHTA